MPNLTNVNNAKEYFWRKGGVFEKFCDVSYLNIINMPYHGSEIDKFIEEIYKEKDIELEALKIEIANLKQNNIKPLDILSSNPI